MACAQLLGPIERAVDIRGAAYAAAGRLGRAPRAFQPTLAVRQHQQGWNVAIFDHVERIMRHLRGHRQRPFLLGGYSAQRGQIVANAEE